MNFERGKDIKKSLDIGLHKALEDIIGRHFKGPLNPNDGKTIKQKIIDDIEEFTGWKEAKDIPKDGYPYIIPFRCVDPIDHNVRIIKINIGD
jgi:hypothetical protein